MLKRRGRDDISTVWAISARDFEPLERFFGNLMLGVQNDISTAKCAGFEEMKAAAQARDVGAEGDPFDDARQL